LDENDMLIRLRSWFRRSVFQTYRFLKHPRKLRQRPVMRWFARHFLDKQVWKPTQHTFSGGMAIGWFITLQLLPIQMPTATILCALFRVNIPIALAICWVSNPVTVMLIGGLVLGAICAAVSYVATWGVWEIAHRMEVAKRARHIAAEKAKHAHG